MGAFEQEFHGIRFQIPDGSYYETVDGLSWGVNPTYAHEWNGHPVAEEEQRWEAEQERKKVPPKKRGK
jgi:hypothetical protein